MASTFQSLVIRDVTLKDALQISELHSAVSCEGVLSWGSDKTESETQEWLGHLLRLKYPCLVACSSPGEVVACAAFQQGWVVREDAGSINCVKLHIVVAKDRRKIGLAAHLFELLQAHPKAKARQIYRVWCESLSSTYSS